MKTATKKALSFFLTLVMAFTMVPAVALPFAPTAYAEEADAIVLSPGANELEVDWTGVPFPLVFTPEETGEYRFYSVCDYDTVAKVGDDTYDDEIGNQFSFTAQLTADEPFTFALTFFEEGDLACEVTVYVVRLTEQNYTLATGDNRFAVRIDDPVATVTFTPESDGVYFFFRQRHGFRRESGGKRRALRFIL